MASLAKKRALGTGEQPEEDHEESSDEGKEGVGDSGDDDSEDSDEEINEEITVDFEAHTISDSDSNGIKKLLKQLFLKANINLSQLTDLIIQQNHIGSVIRQADVPEDSDNDDDDDDIDEVFGFISLLNLAEGKGSECVEQIKELVLEHCEKCCPKNIAEQLDKILNDTTKLVGLLLSERFINVPPQIALPLHKQLQEEIAEAQRTNKPTGKCHFYIMISKTFKEAGKNNSTLTGGAPKKEELMFTNAEEEFFHEHAVLKFNYSVQDESDSCLAGRWSFDDVPMKPFRTASEYFGKSWSRCEPQEWKWKGQDDVKGNISLWTPLMRVSAVTGNADVASLLVKAGADVNVRDKDGKTPFMVAALNNHKELVQLLSEKGADHQYGAGVLDMAKAFGRQRYLKFLF